MQQFFEILGSGVYLPSTVVSSDEIDDRCRLPRGWTAEHVGVARRHECRPPETLATMARQAVRAALADARTSWSEVDLLIDASASRHRPIPCNAAHVLAEFDEARGIPGFDIQSTCLGFLVALQVANGLLATGSCRRIVLVCSEAPLGGVNWKQAESAALLSDGAAAVVLAARPPTQTMGYRHQTFAEHLDICRVQGGTHVLPPFEYGPHNDADFRFSMDGSRLVRVAYKHLPPMVNELLAEQRVDRSRLHVVPHQASPRAVAVVQRLLEFDPSRYYNLVAEMGNLVSASVPAVLHRCRAEGLIRRADDVLLLGTSAGYSQAALLFRM